MEADLGRIVLRRDCQVLWKNKDDDPFAGEDELPSLQELLHKIDSACDAQTLIFSEDQIDICQGYINESNSNWREDVRNELLDDKDDEMPASPEKREKCNDIDEVDDIDEFDPELKPPAISIQYHRQRG